MRRRGARALALATVFTLALIGCGGDENDRVGGRTDLSDDPVDADIGAPPSAGDLQGRTFGATAVDGADLAPTGTLVVTFEDGRMSIAGGCNGMSASYELEGDTLVTGDDFVQTAMACDRQLMDQDEWVVALLTGRPAVGLSGDVLTVKGGDVRVELRRDEDRG